MNIYFLVEGKRTEMKVYPKWLSFLVPELQKVNYYHEVKTNNYYLFSGNGYPSLLNNHLRNSVDDINNAGNFSYFVICLDADEQAIDNCRKEIVDFMAKEQIILKSNTQFEIIVQNKCLETWFLGNTNIFKKNPSSVFLKKCIDFYNVKVDDPELMEKMDEFEDSISVFHSVYFEELLWEKAKVRYSKKNPREVVQQYFLDKLIDRNTKTGHIQSFKYFIDFCTKIRREITTFEL